MTQSRFDAHVPGTSAATALSSSEESRRFFQTRLTLLAKIASSLILLHVVLANVVLLAVGRYTWVDVGRDLGNYVSLSCGLFWATLWLVCRRGERSFRALRLLDPIAAVSYSSAVALQAWLAKDSPFIIHNSILPLTYAVIARAVIIPSSAQRTAWVSTLCFVPAFVVYYFILHRGGGAAWPDVVERPSYVLVVVRGFFSVALATIVSQVIYGLQRQVHKARQLGQYRLEEKIGQGGMGEVYRARHAMLRRPTAVKLLRPEMAGEQSIARFEREVQLTSQLTHPNTIAIYDFGRTPEGTFYYAMEFLAGINLDDLVKEFGPQSPGRVIFVLKQVCLSLAEAHATGLIHRDIKPANIILCERGTLHDVAKVVDFGLVKDVETGASTTLSGVNAITGTPLYMSPEAIKSPENLDARSDIYAVGAVGYYLLTGRSLFDTVNLMEVCSLQLTQMPESPSQRLETAVPADLEGLIMSCLQKERADRPASAKELAGELSRCSDAAAWSEAEAESWWNDHQPRIGATFSEAPTIGDPGSGDSWEKPTSLGATVTIDVDGRL